MVQLHDRRFQDNWPIRLQVLKQAADNWMRYFSAACEEHGWSLSGLTQHERQEDSGTVTINKQATALITVVWERKRGGMMNIRARPEAPLELSLPDLQALLDQVVARCAARVTQEFFRWGCLEYEGLAWRGELWLDDKVRLGPPSRQDETALLGPRVVLVSALVQAVSTRDAGYVFEKDLQELCAFLSVIMRTNVEHTNQRRTWTWEIGANGTTISGVRSLGYIEQHGPTQMPVRATVASVPLYSVTRPDNAIRGIDGMQTEIALPEDVFELWEHFRALDDQQRRKFLQVAAKWQEALMHWQERSTLSFALMVIACEALKPSNQQFNDHGIDDVVEALLGAPTAARLKHDWFRAHHIRSVHLHLGELRGSEFEIRTLLPSFYDPTFDEARRELFRVTNETIIQWLRRGGAFTLPVVSQSITTRRWMRQNVFILLPLVLVAGIVLGWVLHVIWD
jgi:hypothetical protein